MMLTNDPLSSIVVVFMAFTKFEEELHLFSSTSILASLTLNKECKNISISAPLVKVLLVTIREDLLITFICLQVEKSFL